MEIGSKKAAFVSGLLQKREEKAEQAKANAARFKRKRGATSDNIATIYQPLPQLLNPSHMKAVPLDAFARRHLDGKAAIESIINDKIRGKSLSFDRVADEEDEERPRKRPKKSLSSKERKELGLFDLQPEDCIYQNFVPLHELWVQYFTDLTANVNESDYNLKLLKADLHGVSLKVTKSASPQFVGDEGIVVQETAQTFKIVTRENKLRLIPKKNSIFTFKANERVITIFGNNILMRPHERSVKKFKNKTSIDIL